MSDDQQGQEKPEKETQSSMPDENKPTDSEGLPEEAKERTKEQFEKLKESNKQLKQEMDKLKEKEGRQPQPSVLESLRPQNPPQGKRQPGQVSSSQYSHLNQQQVESIQDNLVQKGEDGYDYVDPRQLQQQLKAANERAKRAELEAKRTRQQFTKYEEDQQIKETYEKYPQLDPNGEQYDPNFYNLVKGELVSQAMKGEKNLLKAATNVESALKSYGSKQDEVKETKSKKTEVKEKKTQKQQINASGSAKGKRSQAEFEQLRERTLQGKKGAVAERLRRSGY